MPFVSANFPPPGLVSYGDASVNANAPLTKNFFAIDFNSVAQNLPADARPTKYYLRVVPLDGDGNPVTKPSNFVRVDVPPQQ